MREVMKEIFDSYDCVLAEAAVVERLRRNNAIELDDALVHAPLIYSETGRAALYAIYQEYMKIAGKWNLPLLMYTPTWRTNKERVFNSNIDQNINIDAVNLLKQFVNKSPNKPPVKLGGLIGCKNDCYLPCEALTTEEAKVFHSWQIDQLACGEVDFLIAVTLPSVKEAAGIALAMEETGLPYILSFVVGADGNILDNTSLEYAIEHIDAITTKKPLGYFVNCSYPSFLRVPNQPKKIFERLIGIQANASSLSHAELEGATEIQRESVADWGELMIQLNREYSVKVLGGCCGTDGEHLKYLSACYKG